MKPGSADFSRRRALALALVHVAIAAHIVHWRLAGRTLAPLELNEVVYTVAAGVVTAGFLFMAAICVATAVVGRFFCSWGCHLLALQDLCAWLLARAGIAPRPLRSRVLRWIAPLAALYMFAAPAAYRWISGLGTAKLHTRGDAEGWASFLTDDFWRNLPGPAVAVVTLAVCGFALPYLLGSRSFCSAVCPYGAVFGAIDRLASGRIVARGDCSDCGRCTAVCQSHVRVHAELVRFGTVVDPACLRDLDCVAACPEGKVAFGFTRPPLLRSWSALRGLPRRWDLGERAEAALGIVLAVAFLSLRGLYGAVPLLLALALAVVVGFGSVLSIRVLTRPEARLARLRLRAGGKLTPAGAAFLAAQAALLAFVAHSAAVRGTMFLAGRSLDAAAAAGSTAVSRELAEVARARFDRARRWGLAPLPGLDERLALADELRRRE